MMSALRAKSGVMQCSNFQGCRPASLDNSTDEREACLPQQGVMLCFASTPVVIAS